MNPIDEILRIITDCDYVQESQESSYTKIQAKISAYDEIREILMGEKR